MPVRMSTNWEAVHIKVGSNAPVKIGDVTCIMEEPQFAKDDAYVGIDLSSSDSFTYTFDMQLTCKEYKRITSLVGRGNNWRRMHGKKLIRVPLKERRKHGYA